MLSKTPSQVMYLPREEGIEVHLEYSNDVAKLEREDQKRW
jgi:hypothetical protein